MASTVNVSIQVDRDMPVSELASTEHNSYNKLGNLISGLSSGAINGNVRIGYLQGTAPAVATATITITYASIAANDTVVVGQTTFTCKASGANGTTEFNKVTDASATADSLVTALNANTTTSKYLVATQAAGVVTLTFKERSYLANAVLLSKTGTGIAVTQPTGGVGPTSTPVTFT